MLILSLSRSLKNAEEHMHSADFNMVEKACSVHGASIERRSRRSKLSNSACPYILGDLAVGHLKAPMVGRNPIVAGRAPAASRRPKAPIPTEHNEAV